MSELGLKDEREENEQKLEDKERGEAERRRRSQVEARNQEEKKPVVTTKQISARFTQKRNNQTKKKHLKYILE